MKRKIMIMVMLTFFVLMSVAGACASDEAMASENSLEIDQTTDDVIGADEDAKIASFEENEILTSDEQSFTQLNTTINGNKDKEIYLDSNYMYYSGEDSFKKGIEIDRDVTIYGNGHTINGNKEARIFKVTGGNVVFYNITFVNGTAQGEDGGAIYGNCKAINCNFTENKAWHGGAMYCGSAVNCTFTGNSGPEGGAIYNGSAVNCTFTENEAAEGGAMYCGSAVNCTFTGNSGAGKSMYMGYMLNCIGDISDWDVEGTQDLALQWDVNNFTTLCGSGETLPIQLKNQADELIAFINYDVIIYKNRDKVKTYHCLSNDDLSLDLLPGIYTAELTVTYPGLTVEPKNITLAKTDGTTFRDLNNTINGNPDKAITLNKDYAFNSTVDSAFSEGIVIARPVTINGNGAVIDAKGNAKIFTVQSENVTFKNITFKNGKSSSNFGGAIYFKNGGSLFDCTFMNNTAEIGGAVYLYSGNSTVHRCTFINNTAFDSYSAIQLSFGNGSVIGCVFMDNIAGNGVVGTDSESHGQIEIANNIFLNNTVIMDVINFACNENLTTDYNWFGNVAEDYDNGVPSPTSNIWLFLNATSGTNPVAISGSSVIVFKLYAYNKTNLSAFDYDNSLLMPVQLAISAISGSVDRKAAILGESIRFTPANIGTGRVTAEMGNVSQSIELEIIKAKSILTAKAISATYNKKKYLIITLKDNRGKALSGVKITVNLKGSKTYTTDRNGQVKINVAKLVPKRYTAKIAFAGNNNYLKSSASVKVTVKKAKAKLIAKKKTYKVTAKSKKFKITLKDNRGKPIKNAKVSLKVIKITKKSKNKPKSKKKVKQNIVKTNSKGKATFKVTRTAKAKYMAIIKFAGNKYYSKATKKVKITIK